MKIFRGGGGWRGWVRFAGINQIDGCKGVILLSNCGAECDLQQGHVVMRTRSYAREKAECSVKVRRRRVAG